MTTATPLPATSAASAPRIGEVDLCKGALVVLMVVYHSLNYLEYGTVPHDYLGFVPASFVMITGFLVTNVYLSRRKQSFGSVSARVGIRALKLLVLFTVLNVGARLFWSQNRYGVEVGVGDFFGRWESIYLLGGTQGVAFDVLVPIAYTLIACIPLVYYQERPLVTQIAAVAAFGLCAILYLTGNSVSTLNLISAGLIGAAIGSLSFNALDRWSRSAGVLLLAVGAYVALVALKIDNYFAQIAITIGWLLILYRLATLTAEGWWVAQVNLLGRYSLLSYVAQIFFLQATDFLLAAAPMSYRAVLLSVVITVLTWGAVAVTDALRGRVRIIDRMYKFVFA